MTDEVQISSNPKWTINIIRNSLGVFTFRFIYIQYNFVSSHRCKKVYDGVTHAAKLYPNAYVIMILIGTLKGKLEFLLLV